MSWDCEGSAWACCKCGARWKTGEPTGCTCAPITLDAVSSLPEQLPILLFSAAPKKDRAKLQRLATVEGILEALVMDFNSIDQDVAKWGGPAKRADARAKIGRLIIETQTKIAEIGVTQSLSNGIARIEGEN